MKNLIVSFVFLIIFLIQPLHFYSQTYAKVSWTQYFDNLTPKHTLKGDIDRYGNLYVIGSTHTSEIDNDILVSKIAPDGKLLWKSVLGHSCKGYDYGIDISVDLNGNAYILGESKTRPESEFDLSLYKISNSGELLWSRYYGGRAYKNDIPTNMVIDHDFNIIVVGSFLDTLDNKDIAIVKYSGDGELLWLNKYDCNKLDDTPQGVAIDEYNNVYVVGISYVEANKNELTILKISSEGEQILVCNDSLSISKSILPTISTLVNKKIVVVGSNFDSKSNNKFFLNQYDNNLRKEWFLKNNDTLKVNRPTDFCIDRNGYITVVGNSKSLNKPNSWFAQQYSPLGVPIWNEKNLFPKSESIRRAHQFSPSYDFLINPVVCNDDNGNLLISGDCKYNNGDKQTFESCEVGLYLFSSDISSFWSGKHIEKNGNIMISDILTFYNSFYLIGNTNGDQYKYFVSKYKYFNIDNERIFYKGKHKGYYKNSFTVRFDLNRLRNDSAWRDRSQYFLLTDLLYPRDMKQVRQKLPKKLKNNDIWIRWMSSNRFILVTDCIGMEKKVLRSLRRHFPLIIEVHVRTFDRTLRPL